MCRKILFLTFFVLLLPMLVSAQTTTGRLRGRITDRQNGEPLIGATVQLVGTSSGATTDANGEYRINNIQPGVYSLRVSYIGYTTITVNNIRVSADLTVEQNTSLPPEGVTVATVDVTAQRPLVNKSNTNAVRITTSEDIQDLPVRGINNIIGLTAGVVLKDNTVFIRGGRLDEVGYYLEGVSVTNPVTGGRAVTINQDAVEEIQVQAGGYTAEFGGANAGIIRSQLKTGPKDWKATLEYVTDNVTFKSQNNIYDGKKRLGAYWYGYDQMTGTFGGPLGDERFRFFGLIDYNFQRDANPQPYPGFSFNSIYNPTMQDTISLNYNAGPVRGNQNRTYTYTGTLNLDFKPVILRLAGTFSNRQFQNSFTSRISGNIANIFNNARIEQNIINDGSFSLKVTHILNANMFYELTGGYFLQTVKRQDPYLKDDILAYGDSVANAAAGFVWQRRAGSAYGRFIRPTQFDLYNFSFSAPGNPVANYQKARRENMSLNGALSWNIGNEHALKVGGEFTRYTIRNYAFGNEALFALAGLVYNNNNLPDSDPGKKTLEQIYISRGVNAYGYDALGNQYNGGGTFAPKHPVFAAAYVQDRIEFRDLIINAGLRYDYINTDNYVLTDPAHPEINFSASTSEVYENTLTKAPSFSAVSPRIGLSFPVTDQTVFHAQYGKFVQQTRLNDIYQGLTATAQNLAGGLFILVPVGFNLRPTRTTQYELGFSQQIGDFASFDITGYYKDISDQVVYDQQQTGAGSPFKGYYVLRNGDFATTKGLELTFNMRRTERIAVNASLSFQDARGTGSFPNSNRGIVGSPLEGGPFTPQYISPLEYNNSFRGNLNVDYRFGKDDGPAVLNDFGVSAILSFNSGHPFTRGIGGADLEGDARDRRPIEPLNASVTPSTFQVDLKIDKTVRLFDAVNANIYLFVINLFDRRNVENVFLRTGTTTDDGFLTDPKLSGDLGKDPQYVALYRAFNIDYYEQYQNAPGLYTAPYFYGAPRQIRLGIRLEY